jgi:hypothetical protein
MNRIVLTMSLAATLDPAIDGGAHRLLSYVRSLAGHRRMVVVLTKALATALGKCTNTIRNYRDPLVAGGYIWWVTDKKTGKTTIFLREKVEPPSRRAQLADERQAERQAKAWPRMPNNSKLGGGAQKFAPIKTSKKESLSCTQWVPVDMWKKLQGGPQPPVRTVAEQLAVLASWT